MLFSIVAVPIYTPTNSEGGFPSVHTLCRIYNLWLFYVSHSRLSEVISHCSSDLHFSNN